MHLFTLLTTLLLTTAAPNEGGLDKPPLPPLPTGPALPAWQTPVKPPPVSEAICPSAGKYPKEALELPSPVALAGIPEGGAVWPNQGVGAVVVLPLADAKRFRAYAIDPAAPRIVAAVEGSIAGELPRLALASAGTPLIRLPPPTGPCSAGLRVPEDGHPNPGFAPRLLDIAVQLDAAARLVSSLDPAAFADDKLTAPDVAGSDWQLLPLPKTPAGVLFVLPDANGPGTFRALFVDLERQQVTAVRDGYMLAHIGALLASNPGPNGSVEIVSGLAGSGIVVVCAPPKPSGPRGWPDLLGAALRVGRLLGWAQAARPMPQGLRPRDVLPQRQ